MLFLPLTEGRKSFLFSPQESKKGKGAWHSFLPTKINREGGKRKMREREEKRRRVFGWGALLALLLFLFPEAAQAEVLGPAELQTALNTMWVLLAGFLVFSMHAGFSLVEVGFTRAKNSVNILMKNFITVALGVIVFFAVGFALAFGGDLNGLIGTKGFFLLGSKEFDFGVPFMAFWFFQAVFAATSATIVSGAMAERTKFVSYIIFTAILVAFTYPVVAHWIWGGGWLADRGFIDFAGSTVVHSVGGWSALIGAFLVGPRLGKYGPKEEINAIPGHNIPLGMLGVMILWFGWFGFNPGSTLSGTDPRIASIAVTTILAASAATLSSLFFSWYRYKKPDISLTLNGALAGLVAITAGTAAVSPLGAVVIGLLAGIILILAVEFFDHRLKIDDPVGAISVHGVSGASGTLLVGLFAKDGGLFYGGGFELLGIQALGVAVVFIWTITMALIAFKLIDSKIGLRVSAEEEIEGLDIGEHGSSAYHELTLEVFPSFEGKGAIGGEKA